MQAPPDVRTDLYKRCFMLAAVGATLACSTLACEREQEPRDEPHGGATEEIDGERQPVRGQERGDLEERLSDKPFLPGRGRLRHGDAAAVPIPGRLSGTVLSVNRSEGTFLIQTDQGRQTVRANPLQIGALQRGERFSGPYAAYGDEIWLTGNLGDLDTPQGPKAAVSGTIEHVDNSTGEISVSTGRETVELKVHPAQVQGLVPGQRVRISFKEMFDRRWVRDIRVL